MLTTRRLAGIIGLILVIPAWAFLAPPRLGGDTTYARITGVSMRPAITAGQVVAIRPAADYRVGDVVAYRNSMGSLVMHRIIEVEGGRFTLKGDANPWIDGDTPTASAIVGRQWFTLPAAATGTPALLLLGLAPAVLLVRKRSARGKRALHGDAAGAAPPQVGPEAPQGDDEMDTRREWTTLIAAASLTALFIGATAFAMTGLSGAPRVERGPFTHEARMTYTATVPRGAAYPSGAVRTGDPAFLRVVNSLDLTYAYRIDAPAGVAIGGTTSMRATISDGSSSWSRVVELGATPFEGATSTATARLDLRTLRRIADRLQAETGTRPPHYDVTLHARADVIGLSDAGRTTTSLETTVPFTMNELVLMPVLAREGGIGAADAPEFRASGTGSVVRESPGPTDIAGITGTTVRAGGFVGACIFLLMTALAATRIWRQRRATPRTPRRIRELVIDATDRELAGHHASITVGSMDDLAWIAEQRSEPILRAVTDGGERFEVRDGDLTYRYERIDAKESRVAAHA